MRCAVLFTAALLAACAGRPPPVAELPTPVRAVGPAEPATPAPTPINAGLSPAGTLWHLRAGLNVAALACRGPEEATLIARYNALLAHEKSALAAADAAYRAEWGAGEGARDRYDDEMTRLYNFFGQARGRQAFCRAAGEALAALDAEGGQALRTEAAARLAELDRPFAPPWIAIDPRVFGAPAVQVAAR